MKEIRFFIREEPYGFLSNFERTPFIGKSLWGTHMYPTNEHFYQAQKANCKEMHDYILSAPYARVAMVVGRQLEHNKYLKDKYMRKEWDKLKKPTMLLGIDLKFRDPRLRKLLLDTGDAILIENNPEDPFWGIGDGSGESWLGKLEMQIREKIRQYGGN